MTREQEEDWMDSCMQEALKKRKEKANLRRLQYGTPSINADDHDDGVGTRMLDFSSNDYLGLARNPEQHALVERLYQKECSAAAATSSFLGSTGSRLLSGDAPHFHRLEEYLARVHNRPTDAALLCNSGYDANLSVVSSLPSNVVIVYDEYVHNSLHMGMRLWKSQSTSSSSRTASTKETIPFQHNSVHHLEQVLQRLSSSSSSISTTNHHQRRAGVVVLVESVYSMDGDIAPLREMLDVASRYQGVVIVDEAHGLGVFGRQRKSATRSTSRHLPRGTGVLAQYELERHPALLCSIHTFGKAPGCHGAVVCCRQASMKDYLVNFAYPFIYSTALPLHAVVAIRASYDTFTGVRGDELRARVFSLIQLFHERLSRILPISDVDRHARSDTSNSRDQQRVFLLPSTSPIQALMIAGNARCASFCQGLYAKSKRRVLLYPIKSPTVPAGQERVRIILHAHNTRDEVEELCNLIQSTLQDMGLLQTARGAHNNRVSEIGNIRWRSKL